MMSTRRHGGWVIALSFFLGFLLTVFPLPHGIELWRPEWTALMVIYWCVAAPARVGVGIAWLIGCLQDALIGTLLGAHGLAFALIAFLTLQLHRRMRILPLWQQALTVLVLLFIVKVILFWVRGISGGADVDWRYWLPVLTGTAIWPLMFVVLRGAQRLYQVQ